MLTVWTRQFAKVALFILGLVGLCLSIVEAQSVRRAKVQILTGPTVHVNRAFANIPHYENLAAGDPDHPGRLITSSMAYPREGGKANIQNCYVSFDGGKTWDMTLKVDEGYWNGDPAVIYGRGDDVFVTALVARDPGRPKDSGPDAPPQHDNNTVVFKSADGGRTWSEASRFGFTDRPFIAIDKTNGPYAGRIYVGAWWFVPRISQDGLRQEELIEGGGPASLQMWRSLDNGKTFLGPVHSAFPPGITFAYVGTAAVLSDGTFALTFGLVKHGRGESLKQDPLIEPNAEIHVITSRDGGETFGRSQKVADWRVDQSLSQGGVLGQLAVDPGSKAFKDRLYVVYPEIVSDRLQVRFSYSSDKGKTWSPPAIVNDDRTPERGGKGPDHLLPSVGVNKDGVVLVTWYDRREAKDNLGWRLRAAASLDGGETFSASVPVTGFVNSYPPTTPWDLWATASPNEQASMVSLGFKIHYFFISGGHTSGLAVDADGTFHPTWIDNHTGVSQLWTTSIKVDGSVVKGGSPDLADLEDISKSVTFQLSKLVFDRAKGILTVVAQLKNVSNNKVEGPVKVRVLTLESELGVPEITNADNGELGTGAVWDFSGQLAGAQLEPMKLSEPKTLTFRISDVRALASGREFKNGLITLDTRVFGKFKK